MFLNYCSFFSYTTEVSDKSKWIQKEQNAQPSRPGSSCEAAASAPTQPASHRVFPGLHERSFWFPVLGLRSSSGCSSYLRKLPSAQQPGPAAALVIRVREAPAELSLGGPLLWCRWRRWTERTDKKRDKKGASEGREKRMGGEGIEAA